MTWIGAAHAPKRPHHFGRILFLNVRGGGTMFSLTNFACPPFPLHMRLCSVPCVCVYLVTNLSGTHPDYTTYVAIRQVFGARRALSVEESRASCDKTWRVGGVFTRPIDPTGNKLETRRINAECRSLSLIHISEPTRRS
eukprot:3431632-Prymnesium_polylepis.1